MGMIEGKLLSRNEIKEIWQIDRSELIESVYYFVDGTLILKPEHYDAKGWPLGEAEKHTPILEACFDRGGWFYGLLANSYSTWQPPKRVSVDFDLQTSSYLYRRIVRAALVEIQDE